MSSECLNCPARTVCSSCLGGLEIGRNSLELTNPVFCLTIKEILSQALINISDLKADSNVWSSFQLNLRRSL